MRPGLVAGLIVRNEADRYLPAVLKDLDAYCDRICVLDDGSTDATPDVCLAYPHVHFVRNPSSCFWQNEAMLREQLWAIVTNLEPYWILAIDADEILEERFKRDRDRYLSQMAHPIIGAQLFHFWANTAEYRVDKYWSPSSTHQAMLVRFLPRFPYRWDKRALHCGRIPVNTPGAMLQDGLRCKHFGYANPADLRRKHDLYVAHDPEGHYCLRAHYDSILDPPGVVRLHRWEE